ncbi:MAG: regulatory protein RecX [Spirochaetaceae bacterium]
MSPKDRQRLCLEEDGTVLLSDLTAAAFRHELRLAHAKALELLARREHTAREIALKLEERGYRAEVISECVAKLKDNNSIDETRFAAYYVEGRLRRSPRGRPAVIAELVRRGVDRALAENVVDSYEAEHPEAFAEALHRALRKVRRDTTSPEKIARRLTRRGFSVGEVRRALEIRNEDL